MKDFDGRLATGDPAPRFTLRDYAGRPYSPAWGTGKWRLLIFLRHRH